MNTGTDPAPASASVSEFGEGPYGMEVDGLDLAARTPQGAHLALRRAWVIAKALTTAGEAIRVRVNRDDDIGVKQRRFLHGPVLGQIAEQVRMPDGTRYVASVWKEHLRDLFLGDCWEMVVVPGRFTSTGRPYRTRRKVRNSTEALNVRQYSDFIDRVIAHAASEWRVEFRFIAGDRQAVKSPATKSQQQHGQQREERRAEPQTRMEKVQ